MNNPLVSVLMPAYNSEKFISEAIESICNQTYLNFEFVILDDCSTDNTWNIIQKYADEDNRIKAFRNDENLNIVKTRNRLFNLADSKAEYYAIFDSDDLSMENRLEEEVIFLEENMEYGAIGSHNLIIDENSDVIAKRKYETEYEKIKKNILIRSPFAQPSVMIRKSVIDKVGGYVSEKKYNRARDYDLWIRIFNSYRITNVDKYLIKYRLSSTQGKNTHLKETLKSTIHIQKKWMRKIQNNKIQTLFIIFIETILIFSPNVLIFNIFKKMNYNK